MSTKTLSLLLKFTWQRYHIHFEGLVYACSRPFFLVQLYIVFYDSVLLRFCPPFRPQKKKTEVLNH
jgi:hypothetical protein